MFCVVPACLVGLGTARSWCPLQLTCGALCPADIRTGISILICRVDMKSSRLCLREASDHVSQPALRGQPGLARSGCHVRHATLLWQARPRGSRPAGSDDRSTSGFSPTMALAVEKESPRLPSFRTLLNAMPKRPRPGSRSSNVMVERCYTNHALPLIPNGQRRVRSHHAA